MLTSLCETLAMFNISIHYQATSHNSNYSALFLLLPEHIGLTVPKASLLYDYGLSKTKQYL